MTKDDIIRMAREAGLHLATDVKWMPIIGLEYAENFAAIAYAAGAAAENEACAKVCENIYTGEEGCGDWPTPEMCAEAIRARGQHD